MRIEGFLARHADFRVRPADALWAELSPGVAAPGDGAFLLMTPARHGTDGFFAAVLERLP
jgi:16S rRNA (cytosine967-C5)-methyltransferase